MAGAAEGAPPKEKRAKKRKGAAGEEAQPAATAVEASAEPVKKAKKAKVAGEALAAALATSPPAESVALPSETPGLPAEAAGPAQTLLIPIAKPLADGKLSKKLFKLVKKASKRKQAKRGVKEVVKAIRKKAKGLCVLAGDTSPIDVISHLPILCEDNDIPYVFVASKEGLGAAGLTKRPTCCMLVLPKPQKAGDAAGGEEEAAEFSAAYEDALKRVRAVQPSSW